MDNVSKAVQYYENGYMCSQAVFAAFAEEFGITEKQAFQIGACFGGGMCKGEVCGACTGALMVLGMKYGQFDLNDTASRDKGRDMAVKFLDEFDICAAISLAATSGMRKTGTNQGQTDCSERSVRKW